MIQPKLKNIKKENAIDILWSGKMENAIRLFIREGRTHFPIMGGGALVHHHCAADSFTQLCAFGCSFWRDGKEVFSSSAGGNNLDSMIQEYFCPEGTLKQQHQSRAEQSRAEQSRAEQSRAEQSRAEQSRAEQSRAEQRGVIDL